MSDVDPQVLAGVGTGTTTWDDAAQRMRPTAEEQDKFDHNKPASDIELPVESWTEGTSEPPKQAVIDHVYTIQTNLGGSKVTWKKLGAIFKNLFTEAETFLDPYIKEVKANLTQEVLGLATTAISGIVQNASELTNPTTRNQAIAAIIAQAKADGIEVAENIATQALDAVQAHMATVEATEEAAPPTS